MIIVCLLTFQPSTTWLEFLTTFLNFDKYKIFIMVDDIEFDIEPLESNWTEFVFLKTDGLLCTTSGLGIMNPVIPRSHTRPSAWNKAVYHFTHVYLSYENIWFIEDDVFIPCSQSIADMDKKYIGYDLLTASHNINRIGSLDGWQWWKEVPTYLRPPWAHSMVAACRISKNLLIIVKDFALANKDKPSVLFIEFIFNTLSLQNNLKVKAASELANIISNMAALKSPFDFTALRKECLYHPVKDIMLHETLRKSMFDSDR